MLSYFSLIGDKAPPAARDSSEVAHVLIVVVLTLETTSTVGV